MSRYFKLGLITPVHSWNQLFAMLAAAQIAHSRKYCFFCVSLLFIILLYWVIVLLSKRINTLKM